MNLTEQLKGLTTIITTSGPDTQGTGFFYQLLEDTQNDEPHWAQIHGTYLVTNRHVLIPKLGGTEIVPASIRYHWRVPTAGRLEWHPIELTRQELLDNAKFHPDPTVDIALLPLYEHGGEAADSTMRQPMPDYAVSNTKVAGRNKIEIETSDDVLVLGYPRGFYDEENLFPIVKSGIIASSWGQNFNDNPYFLIDTKLFPGSSGSVVISKPRAFILEDRKMMFPQDGTKRFAFLGVFSGEPFKQAAPVQLEGMTITPEHKFDVGIVWYASLVEEIARNGISYNGQ